MNITQQDIFVQLMFNHDDTTDICASSKLPVAIGLDVYRNNLRLAWRHALQSTFPVVTQLLGEDGMALLARDYLKQHPSQSGDLNHLGQHLSEFVSDYAPLRDLIYLSDVVALEWLVHLAHDAANHVPLDVSGLVRYSVNDWLSARVMFAPSVFVLSTKTAAATIWLAHQIDGDLSALHSRSLLVQPECIVVYRPIWQVEVCIIDVPTQVFLSQLQGKATFLQALEYLEQQQIDFDLTLMLPKLIQLGIWSSIYFEEQI